MKIFIVLSLVLGMMIVSINGFILVREVNARHDMEKKNDMERGQHPDYVHGDRR